MIRLFLIILVNINLFAMTEAELYKKAFGIIPDETNELSLYINNKYTKEQLKVITKQMTSNYVYDLNKLNKFVNKIETYKEGVELNKLPYKYEISDNKINLIIPEEDLKPLTISMLENNVEIDSKTSSFYYHIPFYVYQYNGNTEYNYSLNLFYQDFYLHYNKTESYVSYKNWELGNIYTSMYGNIKRKKLKGISYKSDYLKKYTNNTNFSNVYVKDTSLVQIYKENILISQKMVDKGYYNFDNYSNSSFYTIKIKNVKTGEVETIENTLNQEELFNYDLYVGNGLLSGGLQYSFVWNKYLINLETAATSGEDYKEYGFKTNINDFEYTYNYTNDKTKLNQEHKLKYKNFGFKYSIVDQNIYNLYSDTNYSYNGRYLNLNYSNSNLYLSADFNLDTKKYGYSAMYNNQYKDLFYNLIYKKDERQDYFGFNIRMNLYNTNKSTMNLYSNYKNDGSYENKVETTYKLTNNLDAKATFKNIGENDYEVNYKNQYLTSKYIYGGTNYGYFNTNIVGTSKKLTFTNQIPNKKDSVWFIDKGKILDDIVIIDKDTNYQINQRELDFFEDYDKFNFGLEYKENMAGYVKLKKKMNVQFTLEGVEPLEYFIYSKDGVNKTFSSFVNNDKTLYLENVENGEYTLKFKNKTMFIKINEGNVQTNNILKNN